MVICRQTPIILEIKWRIRQTLMLRLAQGLALTAARLAEEQPAFSSPPCWLSPKLMSLMNTWYWSWPVKGQSHQVLAGNLERPSGRGQAKYAGLGSILLRGLLPSL